MSDQNATHVSAEVHHSELDDGNLVAPATTKRSEQSTISENGFEQSGDSHDHVNTTFENGEHEDSIVVSSPLPHVASTPLFRSPDGGNSKRRTPRLRTVSTTSNFSSTSRQKKIYSVSFQDNGFSYRETSILDANERWGVSFGNPNDTDRSEVDTTAADKSNDVSMFASTSPSVPIPSTPCRFGNDAADLSPRETTSGDSTKRNATSYQAMATSPPSNKPSPVVFCIHGNKVGVAYCCDDLWPAGDQTNDSNVTTTDDKAPLVDNEMGQKRLQRHRSQDEQHCHTGEGGGNGIDKRARRKLIIASVLCLIFMLVEIVGGVLANSLAIATDAAHLLTDFASFMISLFSLWVASRPATRQMSFGWHRAEVIGATVSVLLIWVVTGVLVYAAIQRISSMQFELDPTIMLITSGIGVLVNIIMGCSLHQHGHTHGGGGGGGHGHSHEAGSQHGHSHEADSNDVENQARAAEAKKRENINVRAAFIHVIGDFIQSLGVFIAALVIYFYPHLIIIDPICTFIFSVLVLVTTIRILRDTMNVLMEGIPRDVSFTVVQDTFKSVEGIVTVHNLRIWGLTTDKTALSAHLVIAPGVNFQQVLQEASTKIRAKYNFYEMTLQVEEFHEDMEDCNQCQEPE